MFRRFIRLAMFSVFALTGCTAADVTPDRISIAETFDNDSGEFRSTTIQLQWTIPQP